MNKFFTTIAILLSSLFAFAQNDTTVEFIIKNFEPLGTTPNQYQFTYEVWAKNTGAASAGIRAYSWGLNPTNLPAGVTYTHSFITRDAGLTGIVPPPNVAYVNSQIRSTNTPGALSYAMTPNVEVLIAKCLVSRVVSPVVGSGVPSPFGIDVNPFVPQTTGSPSIMQISQQGGKTQAFISAVVNGGFLGLNSPPANTYVFDLNNIMVSAPKLIPSLSLTTTAGYNFLMNASTPLPVSYTSFTGQKEKQGNFLQWTSASESNNSFFTLEHSTTGIQFSPISKIQTKALQGTSVTPLHYSYMHTNPSKGKNYYRLAQTDIDGKVNFNSTILLLEYSDASANISIYPNPMNEKLYIDLQSSSANATSISILDMQGKTCKFLAIDSKEANSVINMNVQDIADGMYILQINQGDQILQSQKIQKGK